MRKKLWITCMAGLIGLTAALPNRLFASAQPSARICLAPGSLCDARDQCCSHFCNKDPGAPGTCE
jgi:hypothetical protein